MVLCVFLFKEVGWGLEGESSEALILAIFPTAVGSVRSECSIDLPLRSVSQLSYLILHMPVKIGKPRLVSPSPQGVPHLSHSVVPHTHWVQSFGLRPLTSWEPSNRSKLLPIRKIGVTTHSRADLEWRGVVGEEVWGGGGSPPPPPPAGTSGLHLSVF